MALAEAFHTNGLGLALDVVRDCEFHGTKARTALGLRYPIMIPSIYLQTTSHIFVC